MKIFNCSNTYNLKTASSQTKYYHWYQTKVSDQMILLDAIHWYDTEHESCLNRNVLPWKSVVSYFLLLSYWSEKLPKQQYSECCTSTAWNIVHDINHCFQAKTQATTNDSWDIANMVPGIFVSSSACRDTKYIYSESEIMYWDCTDWRCISSSTVSK